VNIGESNDVVTLLKFLADTVDAKDPTTVLAATTRLRDKAGKALQISGEHIISNEQIDSAVFAMGEYHGWEEYEGEWGYDRFGENVRTIENVDTGGLV
jgi:hypothetical protein